MSAKAQYGVYHSGKLGSTGCGDLKCSERVVDPYYLGLNLGFTVYCLTHFGQITSINLLLLCKQMTIL